MYRKIDDYFLQWKQSKFRKPLILEGPRQTGKTYSVLEFGKREYENIAYFNFETNPRLFETFNEDISPSYLVPLLSRMAGERIVKEKTLIVFDEIQLCERALTSLKYFQEQENDYHLIAMGSLLGVAVNREKFSFPVGKVDMKTMYPMDFEEYLLSRKEDELVSQIRASFATDASLSPVFHDAAMHLLRTYLCVGGMPEAVRVFNETQNYTLVRHVQTTLLEGYLSDMGKYNDKPGARKTRLTYNNITVQLSRQNTRFMYKLLKKGARASEFENAIEWLCLSGIISQVYRAEQIKKPLANYEDIDSFKIYGSDVGLLCAKKEVIPDDILYMTPEINDFKGGLMENYVNSQLVANGFTTYYWESEREAEIDFIVQYSGEIIPIEVKSSDNTKAKSLSTYMNRFHPAYAIKLSSNNFAFNNQIKTVPLYAVFCIENFQTVTAVP